MKLLIPKLSGRGEITVLNFALTVVSKSLLSLMGYILITDEEINIQDHILRLFLVLQYSFYQVLQNVRKCGFINLF